MWRARHSVVLLMAGLHGSGRMNDDGRVMPARRFPWITTLCSGTRIFLLLKRWHLSGSQEREMQRWRRTLWWCSGLSHCQDVSVREYAVRYRWIGLLLTVAGFRSPHGPVSDLTALEKNMTVAEVFRTAGLSPLGPVPWGTQVPECSPGVYVIARVREPEGGCAPCTLPFIELIPSNLVLDMEHERKRWLPHEPVIYIGRTTRTIRERVRKFYRHKCGKPAPHAGGQVIKLLHCDLRVYWSPAPDPVQSEENMICAFAKQAGQQPFANGNTCGKKKRIQRLE
jgi:hypothetical protein